MLFVGSHHQHLLRCTAAAREAACPPGTISSAARSYSVFVCVGIIYQFQFQFVSVIDMLYADNSARLRVNGHVGSAFRQTNGLRQGLPSARVRSD